MRKLNKFISAITVFSMILSTMPIMQTTTKAETYGNYSYTISDNKVSITDYSGTEAEVYIPATIDGYPVTSIASKAFADNNTLKYVSIPDSVTSIGEYTFSKCTSLTTVDIPESVTSIGAGAFYYCSKLNNVVLPSGLTYINDHTFSDCRALNNIYIPYGVKEIGDNAFAYCYKLVSIEIPDSVTVIRNRTFLDCMNMTSIKLSNNLRYIYAGAFQDCSLLVDIELPDSLRRLSAQAFSSCLNLQKIKIPNGITTIEDYTFANCYKLDEVEIPDSVNSIEAYAFTNTKALTELTIPRSVTTIASDAFSLSSLNTIYGYSNSYAETFANNYNRITFIPLDKPIVNKSNIEINGYQMNVSIGGIRVIYSVEPEVNNLEVVERGTILGLKNYAYTEEMVIGENSDYVMAYAATDKGVSTNHYSSSDTSTSYIMTFTQNIESMSSAGLCAEYYIRAYAKLSDGSYIYSDINTYSIFSVAKELYDNKLMNQPEKHSYLFDNILSVVDPQYPMVEFSYANTLG